MLNGGERVKDTAKQSKVLSKQAGRTVVMFENGIAEQFGDISCSKSG